MAVDATLSPVSEYSNLVDTNTIPLLVAVKEKKNRRWRIVKDLDAEEKTYQISV
jgi:hypothetical protein